MQNNKLKGLLAASATAALLGTAPHAGAFTIASGNGLEASLYGYLRMNATYDFDQNIASPAATGNYGALGPTGEDITGHFNASAQQSRIGMRVATDAGVRFTVEGDFRGASGGFRMRHAYGEYNGFLMGQTWTNFLSFRGFTPSLDVDSHPGVAGFLGRVNQVRYTTGGLSVSVEQTRLQVEGGPATRNSAPTFTARFEDSLGGINYAVGALAHQVTVDDGSTDESELGYIGFIGASWPVTGNLTLHAAANYGDGANTYLYRSGENFISDDAYFDGSSLQTLTGYSGSLGATIKVAERRTVNLAYGAATVDWDDAVDDLGLGAVGDKSETNTKAMINHQWSLTPNLMVGVEYAYHSRKNVDGEKYDSNRIMFASHFSF